MMSDTRFSTVFDAYVTYLRLHPEAREGLKFLPVPHAPEYGTVPYWRDDAGQRWMRWVQEDPAWSTPAKRQRFARELKQLERATAATRLFWDKVRHAVAQLDYGEHE